MMLERGGEAVLGLREEWESSESCEASGYSTQAENHYIEEEDLARAAIGTAKISSYFITQGDDTDLEEGNASSEEDEDNKHTGIFLKQTVADLSAMMAAMSSEN